MAERLIDGENFYRTKDYQRSAIIFMDIIENYPDNATYGDALFLYADSLFLSREYLGAKEWFGRVLDESNKPGIGQYRQRAIERLIEIAIHIGDFEGIDKYFSQMGQMPTPQARYVKGKYYYFKGNLDEAQREFASVSGDKLSELKARYMLGVILTRQNKYKEAIDLFVQGRDMGATTKEERQIVDLFNLGAGRLYYEQGFVEHASECYQRVQENSPYFDAALYEAASVLIRAGDAIRAEQTLEVLTVAVPDSDYIPRAKMLRGNLLLRTGRYDEAEKVFDELIDEFTPVMHELDKIMAEQQDTRQFFFDLVERSLSSLDVSTVLPSQVVQWVGEEPEVKRALELAADLGISRESIKETERLIRLLEAVIDGPSSINALPMLREAKRSSQQLENRLSQLRGRLARIAQKVLGSDSSELAALQEERQSLIRQLATLPTSDAEYERRDQESKQIFERMRKELARQVILIDHISAIAVAVERYISDPKYTEDVPEESIESVRAELSRHRAAMTEMKDQERELRTEVDGALYQIGVNDSRDRVDEEIKDRIRDLARRERDILRGRGGKTGRRLEEVHAAIDSVEQVLIMFGTEIQSEAMRQVDTMRAQVRSEKDKIAGYHANLQLLNDEAEAVVGGVAFENFSNVRRRFYDLVLKADVGIIDVAWLRKEEHTSRITELTKGRLNDMRILDDEFQEVRSGPRD